MDCDCPDFSNCPKCKENCPPPPKKSLSLKGKQKKTAAVPAETHEDDRFRFLTDEQHDKLKEGYIPKNTEKNTKWALSNFESWKQARERSGLESAPDDLLTCSDPGILCTWLSKYIAETRTKQGKPYPPSTLYQLLTGILRYAREKNPEVPNFLDKQDRRFSALHKLMDSVFRNLRTANIGTNVKHAEPFSNEEEDQLWSTGVLGMDSPKALLNAVFYLNGKNFCLRGGEEHRRLALSQIIRKYNPDHYIYTEAGSKNRQGTYQQKYIPNKQVPIYACPAAGNRCHVRILDMYYSKLPEQAFENDVFYLKPSGCPKTSWFVNIPVGRNELGKMVKNMCVDADVAGNKTNHSLRATGATILFNAEVPEKLIQERTGHRSINALRQYERTTPAQQQDVSRIVSSSRMRKGVYGHSTQGEALQCDQLRPTAPFQPIFNFQGCTVNINCNTPQMSPCIPPVPTSVTNEFHLSEREWIEFMKD